MTRFRSLIVLVHAALISLLGSAAHGAVLAPVSVAATSSFPFDDIYRPERLIDGSGLSGGLHGADFDTMLPTALDDRQATPTFDLGGRTALTGVSL